MWPTPARPTAEIRSLHPGVSRSVSPTAQGQVASFATGTATDSAIAAVDRARAMGHGFRRTEEDLRHRPFCLRIRAHPALVSGRHGRNDMAQPDPSLRSRRAAAGQPAGRAYCARRAHVPGAARLHRAETSLAGRVLQLGGPVVIGGLFVVGWAFGLYVLFTTRNWDALTRPLPLAICTLVLAQVALTTIGSGAPQSAISIVGMSVLLVGTVLPALSGVTLWIGRQHPARLWAAEQLIRGKTRSAVYPPLADGVALGVVIAAAGVLADWAR